ncbi:MAG: SsrA RNA (tmRNA)-binding protein [uncultured bacterium]|nr:MAG: SsrA RNA (tmRNA)-binding protein [uncultured bacterium]
MPTVASNKYIRSDYHILEDHEAGLVLTGAEVKSCKTGQVQLKGSYITSQGGELWLIKATISPYQLANQPGYDPLRPRKLLLKHAQILQLLGKLQEPGLTLLPESLYTTRRLVKLKLVLARGKKKFDKRADIKKRDVNRQIARALRQKY